MVCASGIEVVSNQVSHSLLDRRASGEMAQVCAEYGVKILAYGTLAGGFLSEKWLGKTEPDTRTGTWSQMKYKRFIDQAGGWAQLQAVLKVLKSIADKHHVSIANVASKYIMDKAYVAAVIIGARLGTSEHIQDTMQLFDLHLDDTDSRAIMEVQAGTPAIAGDCGDEYRKPPYLTASGDLSHHLSEIPLPFEPTAKGSRISVFSGTSWESMAGYARAVRKGKLIAVSGTTATHGTKMIGGKDPGAQAHFILDKIEAALVSLGGSLADVVRTRVFVHDIKDWEAVAKAHGQRFRDIQPANTLVEAKLVGDGYLVEIEADAILD
jgi:enamine deaminase RidA (YjgF/YER057c/UK114 family)